jgi:RimJ/RimL family protein N-acetyltransferase
MERIPDSEGHRRIGAHVELRTSIPGLTVTSLTVADTDRYWMLVRDSVAHLTAHGDYGDEVRASRTDIAAELSKSDGQLRYAIGHQDVLVGRVDLIPYRPGFYGVGYWLGRASTGRGFATAGVGALIDFAVARLGATDIYAGVTKGNTASEKVLEHLGFAPVADLETYTRFHLSAGQLPDE